MKSVTKLLATLGHWSVTALLFVSAIAFTWQAPFLTNDIAVAARVTPVVAAMDAGDRVKRDNKNLVDNAADKVKEAANKNANRVDRSTDTNGAVERKAQRDAARIEKRADEDAARTKRAIDDNVGAVERTVDKIKDAFGM
ncbi:MAG TPA: hypothetical protein IGS53_21930 [Leptolyngbyaceae cyanobacterium M33_DOE_097]|uniref:Uncharacterized protein n=1 Tax=Oscillatoriales cyanobacterium SpSt-418 TaxID=2282169 RepID=A0A7C3KIY6_9CYAN|nr:hypothetical protein [Leptolyngbyaceae cyanobacterium M33_DOE_097]